MRHLGPRPRSSTSASYELPEFDTPASSKKSLSGGTTGMGRHAYRNSPAPPPYGWPRLALRGMTFASSILGSNSRAKPMWIQSCAARVDLDRPEDRHCDDQQATGTLQSRNHTVDLFASICPERRSRGRCARRLHQRPRKDKISGDRYLELCVVMHRIFQVVISDSETDPWKLGEMAVSRLYEEFPDLTPA